MTLRQTGEEKKASAVFSAAHSIHESALLIRKEASACFRGEKSNWVQARTKLVELEKEVKRLRKAL